MSELHIRARARLQTQAALIKLPFLERCLIIIEIYLLQKWTRQCKRLNWRVATCESPVPAMRAEALLPLFLCTARIAAVRRIGDPFRVALALSEDWHYLLPMHSLSHLSYWNYLASDASWVICCTNAAYAV